MEVEGAKEFLEKVRSSLPQVVSRVTCFVCFYLFFSDKPHVISDQLGLQVLRVVKTKQVTYSVLNHLLDYIQNLEKIGLLEEKEIAHLHDAVQVPNFEKESGFLQQMVLSLLSNVPSLSISADRLEEAFEKPSNS